jgi:hypothetical protein
MSENHEENAKKAFVEEFGTHYNYKGVGAEYDTKLKFFIVGWVKRGLEIERENRKYIAALKKIDETLDKMLRLPYEVRDLIKAVLPKEELCECCGDPSYCVNAVCSVCPKCGSKDNLRTQNENSEGLSEFLCMTCNEYFTAKEKAS